jgi:hypothetical protein
MFWPIASALIAIGLSFQPARQLIEASMFWHMAVQMPLLLLTGWLVGVARPKITNIRILQFFNYEGLTAMLIASFLLAYWMLPSAIDQAVVRFDFDAFKVISLIFCGLVLQNFFFVSKLVVQLFFLGYALSMLTWLGIYFATTELRLCNAYSLESQVLAGKALCALGATLALGWLWKAIRTR